MSFQDEDGNNLTKTELLALATEQAQETVYTINEDIYQKFSFDGGRFEQGQKLLFHAGQQVRAGEIDALFKTATVDTVTPATGPAAGGTPIVITGTNFAGAEGVTVGGVAATAFKVVSNTRIECTTPAHAAGAVAVVVKDDAGDASKASAFTYA